MTSGLDDDGWIPTILLACNQSGLEIEDQWKVGRVVEGRVLSPLNICMAGSKRRSSKGD